MTCDFHPDGEHKCGRPATKVLRRDDVIRHTATVHYRCWRHVREKVMRGYGFVVAEVAA